MLQTVRKKAFFLIKMQLFASIAGRQAELSLMLGLPWQDKKARNPQQCLMQKYNDKQSVKRLANER